MFHSNFKSFFHAPVAQPGMSFSSRLTYAQERYETLTGFKAPCKFDSKEKYRKNAVRITGDRWRKLNQDARQIIKAELGHGPDRDDVVSQYLGAI